MNVIDFRNNERNNNLQIVRCQQLTYLVFFHRTNFPNPMTTTLKSFPRCFSVRSEQFFDPIYGGVNHHLCVVKKCCRKYKQKLLDRLRQRAYQLFCTVLYCTAFLSYDQYNNHSVTAAVRLSIKSRHQYLKKKICLAVISTIDGL